MTQSFAYRSLDAKLNFIQKAFHAVTATRKIREVPDSQIEPRLWGPRRYSSNRLVWLKFLGAAALALWQIFLRFVSWHNGCHYYKYAA
jgi:hypothetical protein